jgi:hypothetical protein
MMNGDYYVCASSSGRTISEELIFKYLADIDSCNWATFREFKETCMGVWHLKAPPNTNLVNISCTCPSHLKKYTTQLV